MVNEQTYSLTEGEYRQDAQAQPLHWRILVAEDNRVNQKIISRQLQQLGYQADLAANGLEVLAALERQSYDVVLMDVQMPEMDGLEATRRIHEQWPPAERPRIIALTASLANEDRAECLTAGMDDFLTKPTSLEELHAALGRCPSMIS